MLLLNVAVAAILATSVLADKTPSPPAPPTVTVSSVPELARVIKTDLESISGPGTVDVTVAGETLLRIKISIPRFNSEICTPIYNRERELDRLYPDLNFDFSFDGPTLARAIKADLETISGPGTVDVSIASQTLFNVRVGLADFRSEIYNPIYDRALELYRLFPDLSFDFYLRLEPAFSEDPHP